MRCHRRFRPRHLIGAFLLLMMGPIAFPAIPLSAQEGPDWEDPNTLGINKEEAHASLFPFETRGLAMARERENSEFFQSLPEFMLLVYTPIR